MMPIIHDVEEGKSNKQSNRWLATSILLNFLFLMNLEFMNFLHKDWGEMDKIWQSVSAACLQSEMY